MIMIWVDELDVERLADERERQRQRERGQHREPSDDWRGSGGTSRAPARTGPPAATAAPPPSAAYDRDAGAASRHAAPCRRCRRARSAAPRRSAPLIEPMPPITTTTKQMISIWSPMPGIDRGDRRRDHAGERGERDAEREHDAVEQLDVDAQRLHHLAVDAPARIIMPSRVRWISQYMPTASAMQTRRHGQAIDRVGQRLGQRDRRRRGSPAPATPCTSLPQTRLRSSSKMRIRP